MIMNRKWVCYKWIYWLVEEMKTTDNSVHHLALNVFALLVGVCHFGVISFYFFGLVSDGKARYVSNLISSDGLYMNLQTLLVLLQLTCCFGFVRFHSSSRTRVAVETLFLCMAWAGWLILILCYGSVSGLSNLHFCGVAIFFCGVVVYFALLILELYFYYPASLVVSRVLMGLYLVSVVFGALFVIGFFNGWGAAWVFEHLAFMAFAASHFFLFLVDLCAEGVGGGGMFGEMKIELSHLTRQESLGGKL